MQKIEASNGIVYYRSEILPCTHAFSTRIGGASPRPETASLNLAFGRGDDDATVLLNLKLFGNAVGFDPHSVISIPQLHSDEVRQVSRIDRGNGYFIKCASGCDGYYTFDSDITLGVKTADCVPVLLCAVDGGGTPLAVSAIHAGWRGTAAGIVKNGVMALISAGVRADSIRAAIGPAIGKCCFEIDADVKDSLSKKLGTGICRELITPSQTRPAKWFADLKSINRRLLIACGITSEQIDVSDECTCCNPYLFYSHRRDSDARGTMLSVINLTPPKLTL